MIGQTIVIIYVLEIVVSQEISMYSYHQLVPEFSNNIGTPIVPPLSPREILKLKSLMKLISDENDISCHRFRTCLECTKNVWSECGWCHDFGCTEHPELVCPNSLNYAQPILNEGIRGCSYLKHTGPLLIPAFVQMKLNLSVQVVDPILYTKEILCQIKTSNKITHVKGTIDKDIINCDPFTLETNKLGDVETGVVNVVWGGMEPFSNLIPIKVYHCESLADNCEACRLIPLEYGCGWCSPMEQCVISDKCSSFGLWKISKLTCEAQNKKLFYV